MRLLARRLLREQGVLLFVRPPRFRVSPVTMPIYLAPSLPLSCEISYNSFMQISRGGLCPVKPERRNLELYDPPTSPSFFFAQTSRNEPRTVIPSFTSSSGYKVRRVESGRRSRAFMRFRSSAPPRENQFRGPSRWRRASRSCSHCRIISRCNNTSVYDTDNLPTLVVSY